jgi:hypothetical protein
LKSSLALVTVALGRRRLGWKMWEWEVTVEELF